RHSEESSLLGRNPDIHEVGKSGLYLISDLSSGVTGETHFVDGGFNAVAVPPEGK
ncbi:SDR family oxidoreductase, partial [SAR116 cluster bacterium]|nr:SDR family oxidoreductase [SAR116 cluster bacterium]